MKGDGVTRVGLFSRRLAIGILLLYVSVGSPIYVNIRTFIIIILILTSRDTGGVVVSVSGAVVVFNEHDVERVRSRLGLCD
jgi:hypothetical protein